MTKSRKIVLSVALLFAVGQLILIGSCTIREIRYEGFWNIKKGHQKEKVINIMETPSEIKRCNSPFGKYAGEFPDGDCFEIYGYFTIFNYKAIAFDRNGKVTKTYEWKFTDGYGKPGEFDFPVTLW